MKILIVGKNSFIGRRFIKRYSRICDIVEYDIENNPIEEIDFIGVDVVIHVAAIVHQSKTLSRELYFEINSNLPFRTALISKEHGVKHFIFLSSIKVFGDVTKDNEVWNEDSQCYPTNSYGLSKLDAEVQLKKLNSDDFTVSIVRPCLVYGEGVKANMYNLIRFVDRFYILPFSNLVNVRNMVYVENLVDLLYALTNKRMSGIFIASDQGAETMIDLIRIIKESLGGNKMMIPLPWQLLNIVSKDIYLKIRGSVRVDASKGYDKINFKPKFCLRDGIKNTIIWYQSNIK